MAIPWFKHAVGTMDSVEFGEIPQGQRTACYGVYMRLRDLIGQTGPWDTLVTNRGLPWTIRQIASKLFMEPEAVEVLITALADAGCIDKKAWVEQRLVKMPEVIAIAADYFARKNAERVLAHLREHGMVDGYTPRKRRDDLTQGLFDGDSPRIADNIGEHPRTSARQTERRDRGEEKEPVSTRGRGRQFGPRVAADAAPPQQRIGLDAAKGEFTGILQEDLERWQRAFPHVDVVATLPKLALVAIDTPNLRDCSAFIRNCLAKDEERARPAAATAIKRDGAWEGVTSGRVDV